MLTNFNGAGINVEIAHFCAVMDILVDQDGRALTVAFSSISSASDCRVVVYFAC